MEIDAPRKKKEIIRVSDLDLGVKKAFSAELILGLKSDGWGGMLVNVEVTGKWEQSREGEESVQRLCGSRVHGAFEETKESSCGWRKGSEWEEWGQSGRWGHTMQGLIDPHEDWALFYSNGKPLMFWKQGVMGANSHTHTHAHTHTHTNHPKWQE